MGDEADAIIHRLSNPNPFRHEEACRVTELPVNMCGCRIHRGAPRPRPASADPFESVTEPKGPWVRASFDSECSGCDGALWVGEDIRADGSGGWEGRCCEDG